MYDLQNPAFTDDDAMTEATLTLIETKISGRTVRLRFADDADPQNEWIAVQVVVPGDYAVGHRTLSDNPDHMPLGAVRLAALERAQSVIGKEIARLSKIFVGPS